MKNKNVIWISGLALFSMFFGAGNLIFPPQLGYNVGSAWFLTTIGFIITGVGLVGLGLYAAYKSGGGVEDLGKKVAPWFAWLFAAAIILSIGPGLAIPRNAATTHEVLQTAFLPNLNPWITSIIFFIIVLIFSLRPSKMIDRLGRILTPILVITVAIIIIFAVVNPIGHTVPKGATNVFSMGVVEGYQTLDALASLAFCAIILNSLRESGMNNEAIANDLKSVIVIACVLLGIIYLGLSYFGATASGMAYDDFSRIQLLNEGTKSVLGNIGQYILSIAMALACLTTVIGLTASTADFFNKLTKGKLTYTAGVWISTIFSFFVSVLGVDTIVAISVPILLAVYPVAMGLIIANLLPDHLNVPAVHIGIVIGALIPTVLGLFGDTWANFEGMLPDVIAAFAWVIPSAILAIICYFLLPSKRKSIEG